MTYRRVREGERDEKIYTRLQLAKRRIRKIFDVKSPNVTEKM